jgi:transposase
MTGHKDIAEAARLEVVETGRRRRWTEQEKLRIVMESLRGSREGSATARRHGISRSLLATWRRQFSVRAAGTSELVPALVVPEKPPPSAASGRMEIVTANGRRVVIDAGVDVAALGRVLDLLERR